MLIKVGDWTPPTTEHVELKKFMMDQIKISNEQNRSIKFYEEELKVEKISGEEWLRNEIEDTKEDIKYYYKRWNKYKETLKNRNEWIRQLKASVK